MLKRHINSAFRYGSTLLLETTICGNKNFLFSCHFLPYGKAESTASSALPRACGKDLQLYPWRLVERSEIPLLGEYAALSTFATLGFSPNLPFTKPLSTKIDNLFIAFFCKTKFTCCFTPLFTIFQA